MSYLENDSIKFLQKSLRKNNNNIPINYNLINKIHNRYLIPNGYLVPNGYLLGNQNVTNIDPQQVEKISTLLVDMINKIREIKKRKMAAAAAPAAPAATPAAPAATPAAAATTPLAAAILPPVTRAYPRRRSPFNPATAATRKISPTREGRDEARNIRTIAARAIIAERARNAFGIDSSTVSAAAATATPPSYLPFDPAAASTAAAAATNEVSINKWCKLILKEKLRELDIMDIDGNINMAKNIITNDEYTNILDYMTDRGYTKEEIDFCLQQSLKIDNIV
jgi:hypothetical protein